MTAIHNSRIPRFRITWPSRNGALSTKRGSPIGYAPAAWSRQCDVRHKVENSETRIRDNFDGYRSSWNASFSPAIACDLGGRARFLQTHEAMAGHAESSRTSVRAEEPPATRIATRLEVRITDIRGLYLPGYPDASPRPPAATRAAGYKPGYKSLDNQGRIYKNRDLRGRWKANVQFIEVTVQVALLEGELPPDARIRWTVVDVDDPFDERSEVDPDWAPYLDGNDFDAAGRYKGPTADDNEGKQAADPPWEQVESYAISDRTQTRATTAIEKMTSKVRYHMPGVAGDNVILHAHLESVTPVEATGDKTGIMTLWHRLDVEYVRMQSAPSLPVEGVQQHFAPAFTQLDFARERVIPDQRYMAPDEDVLGESSARFLAEAFSHQSDPGWFCLIAAMEPYPLPEKRGEVIFNGMVTIRDGGSGEKRLEYIEIPGTHEDAAYVTFRWEGREVSFSVAMATFVREPPERTLLWLMPHDVQPLFTAGDGSIAHAYQSRIFFFPRARRRDTTFEPGGYGIPERVEATVRTAGAFYTAGMSPTIDLGKNQYFAGRTILFTHHGAFWDRARAAPRPAYRQKILHAIVHELVHAFGMPHKCGYFDYRTPRRYTCCMNYDPNWMIDAKLELIPETSERIGNDMCGRHLKEVRRVRPENNRGLRWK